MVHPNPEDDELPVYGPVPLQKRGLRVRQAADPLAGGALGLVLGGALVAFGQWQQLQAQLGSGDSEAGAAFTGVGLLLGVVSLGFLAYGLWAMAANTELAAELAARRLRADELAADDAARSRATD
jgi:hypothetical protein